MTDTPRKPYNATDEESPRQDDELTRRLASLPRETDPGRDLWPGIEARIATSRDRVRPGSRAHRPPVLPPWAVWAGLAAVLLLVAVPLFRWWLPATGDGSGGAAVTGTSMLTGPLVATPVLAWQARQEDDVFVTRQALEMAVGAARETGSLPPDAASGVEESLRVLDRAIGETRAALDLHPADPRLRQLLAQRYRQEAALLHRIDSL